MVIGETMKQLWKTFYYLKKYKKWTFFGIFLIFLEVLMELTMPNIMSNMINQGIGNHDFQYIAWNVVLMIVLTVVGVLGGIGSTYFAAKASGYVNEDMRDALFRKICSLSYVRFDQMKVGNLITVLTNDIITIGNIIMMSLRILLRVPVLFLGSIIMAILISPKLSLILIVLLPIMVFFLTHILRKAFPYFDLTQQATDEVNRVVRENVGGIRVVKANSNESFEKKKFDTVNKELKEVNLKAIYLVISAMPVLMLVINFAILIVLWYGGVHVMEGTFAIGNIMAFIQYLTNILSSVMMGSVMIVMLARSCTSAIRFQTWMDMEEEQELGTLEQSIQGKIEFCNVSFTYEQGTGDAVLKDINIVIEPNQLIGIVGPTGSGKTTFAELLMRNYLPTQGEIYLDDVNIQCWKQESLKTQMAMNFQKVTLFKGTVKENLALSGISEEDEIWKVSKISCAYEFLKKNKEGLDYLLEQKGTNLSGGQKQRLALTRTLLQHPKILILDDSTSAIDAKTERQIIENLKQYQKGTTILISNKISTVKDCDQILVFDDGALVATGTHEQLQQENEFYRMIVETQQKR